MARRYPLEPLVERVGGIAALERIGFDSGDCYRARREGLTERRADRWAVRCGFHPYEVWPEMADDALTDAMTPCAHCGAGFLRMASNHRFCSTPCRTEAQRRTEAGRAANRARRRRGYRENAEYERARERRRYAESKRASA